MSEKKERFTVSKYMLFFYFEDGWMLADDYSIWTKPTNFIPMRIEVCSPKKKKRLIDRMIAGGFLERKEVGWAVTDKGRELAQSWKNLD